MATKKKVTKKTTKKKVTKKVAKKRTTHKKKITEASYEINLSRDVAGAPQQTKKTVQAPTPDQAMDKAKLGDPNIYDEISVKKQGGPSGAPEKAQPQVTPQGAPNTLEDKGKKKRAKKSPVKSYELTSSYTAESFPFPYNIALPRIFEPITEKMVAGTSLKVKDRYALVEVTITDATNMDKVVENLVKSAKGRNKKLKTMAESVIKGIMHGRTK